ncbi:hypothetical protein ACTOB_001414 [Actinoplanes oblitus]|uniref:Uncharacterized protein n=1 Tax=Actinoplanes oblitus TaxID=3040509 RepID=A0ABY8WMV1_9ACTN|nr:hypothetical protein [Actinoplanes oblitus]WIM97858.1 hypothetical protein ACTOB_001414 [Actinoplanes oblitus]
MRRALIYVPAGLVDDAEYANDCIAYARRRGCQGAPLILRDWIDVESAMSAGWFWLVVVARREHRAGHHLGQRAEVAGETVAPVIDLGEQRAVATTRQIICAPYVGRHRVAADVQLARRPVSTMTAERVRRILAGIESAPAGIDPLTVAAMRSIAAQLDGLN